MNAISMLSITHPKTRRRSKWMKYWLSPKEIPNLMLKSDCFQDKQCYYSSLLSFQAISSLTFKNTNCFITENSKKYHSSATHANKWCNRKPSLFNWFLGKIQSNQYHDNSTKNKLMLYLTNPLKKYNKAK